VDTRFWDDTYIAALDPAEKLVFVYLLTNPLTNICGIYEVTIKRIALDTGYTAEVVAAILARFERDGKVLYHDGWIAMKNWIKHQNTKSPDTKTGIARQLKEVPDVMITWVKDGHLPAPSRPPGGPLPAIPPPNSTLLNSTRPNLTEQAAGAAIDGTDLYHSVQAAFESRHGTFSDYGKEGSSIKRLIAKAGKSFPDDPAAFLHELIGAFWRLKVSGDKFWSSQPFTPSALNASGIYDRVCEQLRTQAGPDAETKAAIQGVFK
jgi:hypothetical protein